MKLIVARGRTIVVGDGEYRGPGEEVELEGAEAEQAIARGFVHRPNDFPVPGCGSGPGWNFDSTIGLQPRPQG